MKTKRVQRVSGTRAARADSRAVHERTVVPERAVQLALDYLRALLRGETPAVDDFLVRCPREEQAELLSFLDTFDCLRRMSAKKHNAHQPSAGQQS